jgi:hypothetical protein
MARRATGTFQITVFVEVSMSKRSRTNAAIQSSAIVLGLLLAACAPQGPGGVSAPVGFDAPQRLCSGFGYAEGAGALASCTAKIAGLARQQAEMQSQCEGVRQRGLAARQRSGGIGNTIATADADYQSCMNGELAAPVQLVLPNGRAVTCRLVGQQIACD